MVITMILFCRPESQSQSHQAVLLLDVKGAIDTPKEHKVPRECNTLLMPAAAGTSHILVHAVLKRGILVVFLPIVRTWNLAGILALPTYLPNFTHSFKY